MKITVQICSTRKPHPDDPALKLPDGQTLRAYQVGVIERMMRDLRVKAETLTRAELFAWAKERVRTEMDTYDSAYRAASGGINAPASSTLWIRALELEGVFYASLNKLIDVTTSIADVMITICRTTGGVLPPDNARSDASEEKHRVAAALHCGDGNAAALRSSAFGKLHPAVDAD